jgi:hypothetical protein
MGWITVTDLDPRTKHPVKNPMLGVRWLEMDGEEGYLACRYASNRYIYEGVPRKKFSTIQSTICASSYLRQHIREKYPLVDVNYYDRLLGFTPEGPLPEKHLPKPREVPEGMPEPQMELFVGLAMKAERRSKRS